MKHVRISTAEVLKVRWNGVRNMVGGGERGSEPPMRLRARAAAAAESAERARESEVAEADADEADYMYLSGSDSG